MKKNKKLNTTLDFLKREKIRNIKIKIKDIVTSRTYEWQYQFFRASITCPFYQAVKVLGSEFW